MANENTRITNRARGQGRLRRTFKAGFRSTKRGPVIRVGLKQRPLADLYPYLLEAPWAYVLSFIALDFAAINALFAVGYMLCGGVANARRGSFADLFFFSVQTMATIGYGTMAPGSLGANILASLEALVGMLGLAIVTGLVFAKFSRPIARVRFSRCAVVGMHNGVPCLMFRMANERANQIVEATIHVVMVKRETTLEGRWMWRTYELEMLRYRNNFFALSWLALHPITPSSPLYGSDPRTLSEALSMINVSLTGLDNIYAQVVHARYDYHAADIVWGAQFVDMLHHLEDGTQVADFSRIDEYELDPAVIPKLAAADQTPANAGNHEAPTPSETAKENS
jgi:inward rectifier potassium channel